MSIALNAIRVPGDPTKGQAAFVDIDVNEPGRLDEIRGGVSNIGVNYRVRFSADPTGFPVERVHRLDNVAWVVTVDGKRSATFDPQDPDGDGEYEWIKTGNAPCHGGNHRLGQRTHGNDIVLVFVEGAGSEIMVENFRDGQSVGKAGPFKIAV